MSPKFRKTNLKFFKIKSGAKCGSDHLPVVLANRHQDHHSITQWLILWSVCVCVKNDVRVVHGHELLVVWRLKSLGIFLLSLSPRWVLVWLQTNCLLQGASEGSEANESTGRLHDYIFSSKMASTKTCLFFLVTCVAFFNMRNEH